MNTTVCPPTLDSQLIGTNSVTAAISTASDGRGGVRRGRGRERPRSECPPVRAAIVLTVATPSVPVPVSALFCHLSGQTRRWRKILSDVLLPFGPAGFASSLLVGQLSQVQTLPSSHSASSSSSGFQGGISHSTSLQSLPSPFTAVTRIASIAARQATAQLIRKARNKRLSANFTRTDPQWLEAEAATGCKSHGF